MYPQPCQAPVPEVAPQTIDEFEAPRDVKTIPAKPILESVEKRPERLQQPSAFKPRQVKK